MLANYCLFWGVLVGLGVGLNVHGQVDSESFKSQGGVSTGTTPAAEVRSCTVNTPAAEVRSCSKHSSCMLRLSSFIV